MPCAATLSTDRAVRALCGFPGFAASRDGQRGSEREPPPRGRVRWVHGGAAVSVLDDRLSEPAASARTVPGSGAVDPARTTGLETNPPALRPAGALPAPQDGDPQESDA